MRQAKPSVAHPIRQVTVHADANAAGVCGRVVLHGRDREAPMRPWDAGSTFHSPCGLPLQEAPKKSAGSQVVRAGNITRIASPMSCRKTKGMMPL